ncbi:MAG: hypothetical protein QW051_01180 [Candidatus Aenigmatarchaeota archaeon]
MITKKNKIKKAFDTIKMLFNYILAILIIVGLGFLFAFGVINFIRLFWFGFCKINIEC